MAGNRDSRREERQRAVQRARESYGREFEKKRAAKGGPVKIPPLDPAKFVDQLRKQSWALIHTIAFAATLTTVLILAGRAAGLQAAGAFAALLLIGSLYYYLKIVWDIDLTALGKTTSTVGAFLTYFVTWLMLCFLLSNPPFHDEAPPVIRCCSFYDNPGVPTEWVPVNGTTVNDTDGTVRVSAEVFDNSKVDQVFVDVADPSGTWANGSAMAHTEGHTYTIDLTGLRSGGYSINVRAVDTSGRASASSISLNVE